MCETLLRRAAVAGALLLMTGCAVSQADGESASPEALHTMADGTVMEGETHIHDDGHDHGEEQAGGPSEAAAMVCAGDVVDDVHRIMAVDSSVEPASVWEAPMFTCRFDLAEGPLVLSVHDAEDRVAGMAYFQSERTSHPDVTPLRGVYSLGLPAFETSSGTVAFVKDGKTLEVDASGLPGDRLGVDQSMTRGEVAYAVATSVLACWTEHA